MISLLSLFFVVISLLCDLTLVIHVSINHEHSYSTSTFIDTLTQRQRNSQPPWPGLKARIQKVLPPTDVPCSNAELQFWRHFNQPDFPRCINLIYLVDWEASPGYEVAPRKNMTVTEGRGWIYERDDPDDRGNALKEAIEWKRRFHNGGNTGTEIFIMLHYRNAWQVVQDIYDDPNRLEDVRKSEVSKDTTTNVLITLCASLSVTSILSLCQDWFSQKNQRKGYSVVKEEKKEPQEVVASEHEGVASIYPSLVEIVPLSG